MKPQTNGHQVLWRFLANSQPAATSSGSVSANRYRNTRSSCARWALSSASWAPRSMSRNCPWARVTAWLASSAACCCACTAACALRSAAFSVSSRAVRSISSRSCSGRSVARRVASQLPKVSRAAWLSAWAILSLSCACSSASRASWPARVASFTVWRAFSAAARSMKSSSVARCSTLGRSPTMVPPSPIRKPANTTATTHRPRRNHFSDRRRALLMKNGLSEGSKYYRFASCSWPWGAGEWHFSSHKQAPGAAHRGFQPANTVSTPV